MMMTITLPRPRFRPLPPIAATLALACVLLWFAPPVVTRDIGVFHAALVELVPLFGTGTLALAVRHLLVRLDAPQPGRAAALLFILPSAMVNAGLLGQCDALWAAPCIMAVASAVERKHLAMLAWCGLALGINVQALLIAPFFLVLLINRHVPMRMWPVAPLVAGATMIPAWAAGSPAGDLVSRYLGTSSADTALALGAPNLWQVVEALPVIGALPLYGLALASALGATAAYIAWFSARPLHGRALLAPALLAPLVTAGLLPHMHERSFLLADVLALVMALAVRDRANWQFAAMIQAGSLFALLGYLGGLDAMAMIGAIPMLVATAKIAQPLLRPFANDNPLLARA
ncbi:hypothetical protein BH10PSE14_BH10PSE14_21190 [soil metagenome]